MLVVFNVQNNYITGTIELPILSSELYAILCVFDNADLTIEDSGNYTCEVRGPNSAVLASVVHRLFVRGQHRLLCRINFIGTLMDLITN